MSGDPVDPAGPAAAAPQPDRTAAPAVLALWSAPRSLSTAFLRMMVQRGDYRVFHEPFSDLAALGTGRIGERDVASPRELLDELLRLSGQTPVFFKDTTEYRHVELFSDRRLIDLVTHSFIIRDPRLAIESHYAVNPNVTLAEIGYEHLYEVFDTVRQATGAVPAVIDADALVRQPEPTVAAYCAAVGIAFDGRALSWDPGERDEWSRTSRWHQAAADSSAFAPRERVYATRVDNDPGLARYYEHHLPFYERLREHALTVSVDA